MRSRRLLLLIACTLIAQKASSSSKAPPEAVVTGIEATCPEGWIRHGTNCFQAFPVYQSWPFALATCHRYGAQLPRIETSSENRFIGSLLSKPGKSSEPREFWLGLMAHEDEKDAHFLWSDGTPTSRYVGFWAPNQPDFLNGSCAIGTLDKKELEWRLETCNLLRRFVCQRPVCIKGSFFCASGGCVGESQRCNGQRDCDDASDELNCPASHTSCMTYEKGESGKISSPNYPSSYEPNLNCRFVIEGPVNTRIELTLEHFETEQNFDVLTVLDGGPAENSTIVLESLSGSPSTPLKLTSSTNMLVLRFRTDSQTNARGFHATWRAVPFACGGILTAQAYAQSFASPGYPNSLPNGAECVWTIQTNSGQVVSLTVDEFSLGAEDQLVVYDGPTPSAAALFTMSGNASRKTFVSSTNNVVYVYLMSRVDSRTAKGFSISYKRGCDVTFDERFGEIVSPGNLQSSYPNSMQCVYTVEMAPELVDRPMSVVVNRFDIGTDDFLKVFENSVKGKELHEGDGFSLVQKPPRQLFSRVGRMQLVFKSSASRNANGFNFTYSIDCPVLKVPPMVSISSKATAYATKVKASCPAGFEFASGEGTTKEVECLLGGVWTQPFIAHCQPIFCGAVPQIANGFAKAATNVTFGGFAKYQCYKGFAFPSGKEVETVQCTSEGRWTPSPQCKAATCQPLAAFANGERKLEFGDGTAYGSVFRFACHGGYRREGVETLLCKSDGLWSGQQPSCKRVSCTNLPTISNARIELPHRFVYGDVARVVCEPGFVIDGPEEIRCLANQTLSATPSCVDVDECESGLAQCQDLGTRCVNVAGSYVCSCLPGFQPQLACPSASALTVRSVTASSGETSVSQGSAVHWCAVKADKVRTLAVTFVVPMIVEKIKLEKSIRGRVHAISVKYSETATSARTKRLTIDGQSVFEVNPDDDAVTLPMAIEAGTLEVTIVSVDGEPCTKVEVIGCQRTSCADINECLKHNGYCDHTCINMQGSYKCTCRAGYDLLVESGQGGVNVSASETGRQNLDVVRYNKTCVARTCPGIGAPENGVVLTTETQFRFPMVVQYQCNFGYQMMGPDYIQCLGDGTWNGTTPFCLPATCQGVSNSTSMGLLVTPGNTTIAFGQNVSIACTLANRPVKKTPLATFRQCMFDPQPDGRDYWLSGPAPECPFIECPAPPVMPGAVYQGDVANRRVGAVLEFSCRPPYTVVGRSSYEDSTIRCTTDATWDLGDLRCEGPVCVDPGFPHDGAVELSSVEEGAIARFSCKRPGFRPFPSDSLQCALGAACVLSEDVGISTGFVPDGAFSDNSDQISVGYEPHKARLSSTGWCGSKDAFIFLSVDLQRVYTLTTLRVSGVAGSGHLKGHVTKMQLFHKTQFTQNYDTYPVEFETPSGNHNAMHQFELRPPLRARYILLGVAEYEGHPCMKFDLLGCLAPVSQVREVASHLQVGWNGSLPECVDMEPPKFVNCPAEPIFVKTDANGQLRPVEFQPPTAVDNSGKVAYVRVEPKEMRSGLVLDADTDVVYTAFDGTGNTAVCTLKIRIPDVHPPVLRCPEASSIPAREASLHLKFDQTTVALVVQDSSNITQIRFSPPEATLRVGEFVEVEVTAEDENSNRNTCRFQVAYVAEPCSPASLASSEHTTKRCVHKDATVVCDVACDAGYRFVEIDQQTQNFVCQDGRWSPSNNAPACIPIVDEPAGYHVNVGVAYPVESPVPDHCLKGYAGVSLKFFDQLDKVLSERCSSSVQVFVRILQAEFSNRPGFVNGNYTIQVLPSVLQGVFYDLCGLTLRTIFDLKIPGATTPIKSLLTLNGDSVAAQAVGCPNIAASTSTVGQGFACSSGEVLRQEHKDKLPECLPCPVGSVNVNNTCLLCPRGSYQDESGQIACKACPDGSYTLGEGSHSVSSCLAVCGNGMYSTTGLIPCQLCPRHSFAGPPPIGGFKECTACPAGAYTSKLGSAAASECRLACAAGTYSFTGLEPCSPCPMHHFQPSVGQQRCLECANNTATSSEGETSADACLDVECAAKMCENKASCSISMHRAHCDCQPGFVGERCEKAEDKCATQPCFNGGSCQQIGASYRCVCPQHYSGARCQFETDECVGVLCPNGGVCHDLPGPGTTKCLCRTGFAGPQCDELSDVCSTANPCRNGARCVASQLGRFKCQCVPGWEGITCERNIDDCAEAPCALNATCVDLVNDFRCECPQGFAGKRCQEKVDLCDPSPCVHGVCVDQLHSRRCICEAGWTGDNCDVDVDECEASPCLNAATCVDEAAGYKCQCAAGYEGVNCQHLVDHCSAQPCRNNASCTNLGPTYHCDCQLGFDGIHCEIDVDECANHKCDPIGTESCRDQINGFSCFCKPGYSGKYCDTKIDQCADSPCMNDGQCVDIGGTFKCNCRSGWAGPTCEEEAGSCTAKPCRNDGFCVNLVADYFCVCPPGVSGKNCETAPNRCVGEPCHNGGVCGDFGSHLECSCPPGYSGKGCEYKTHGCRPDSCMNGGECVETGDVHKCQCSPGFAGEKCEKEVDECANSHCPMGATCIDQVDGFICACPFNLTGTNCDKPINVNYDLQFADAVRPSWASLYAPFRVESTAVSVAVWVRFDHPYGHATFLNLHVFGNESRSLVKLASNEARIALFEDVPPLAIPLGASQQLNDGKWNHVVLTWDAHNGSYSLIWNSLRVFAGVGYAVGRHIDQKTGITLGATTSPPFVGAVSRVNVWNRVLDFEDEIPMMVLHCQRSEELHKGLLVRFEGYTKTVGKVERTLRSTCGAEQSKHSNIHHSDPIRVEDCPSDLLVTSHERETNVTWQEPTFVSTVNPIVRVEKNLRQGQLFTWGEYDVMYVATDNATNSAECNFKIRVAKEHCPDVVDPVNGLQSCENWGPQLKYKACSIECRDGFEFPRAPAVFYVCGADGEWRPRGPRGFQFRYPQCTKHVPATRMMVVRVAYSAATACTDASKEAFVAKLVQAVNVIDNKWKMCSLADATGCVGTQVRVSCDNDASKSSDRRRRRTSTSSFHVHVEIPVKRAMLSDPMTGRNTTVNDAIHAEIFANAALNFEKVLPNGRPNLDTLQVDDEFHCQAGQIAVGDLCVPCAPGTFHSATTSQCEICPIGEYQPLAGRTECFKCVAGQVTAGDGATSEADCKANCPPGHHYDATTLGCVPCGLGYFQPTGGSFGCLPCGIGKTTITDRAVSEDDCRDECPDGEQLSPGGTCQPCEAGTFRARGEHKSCVSCPPGTTTEEAGSTRREQCNTPRCKTGQFLVKETKHCQFCPRGTFQNEEQEVTCKLCPPDHTTAAQGATAESQCYSTNQCKTGEYNCSWHANCIDLPDENDVPTYECRCKPGFRGNGTHCTDSCNDYCLNDGVCKKNNVGNVECVCKEHFTGERCELRQQQKMQRMTMVGVCIGVVVTVLIIIVCIVFMISMRFNQVHEAVDEKASTLHELNPSTFLYGSPPIREPPRPVGYYYEDDEVYETKREATLRSERRPTVASLGATSAMTAVPPATSTLEEARMEQRLRVAQQHMYHPSTNE